MEYLEAVLSDELAKTLIALSGDWEAEQSCTGYRKNDRSDLEGNRIFLAKEQGRVIAYLLGHLEKAKKASSVMPDGTPYFELEELYVVPEFRSRGIGRTLYDTARNAVKDETSWILLSTATKDWRKILHFYLEELGMEFWSARLYQKLDET